MSKKAKQYALAVSVAGIALLGVAAVEALSQMGGRARLIRFAVYLAAAAAASVLKMRLPLIDGAHSWSFVVILMAAINLSPGEAVMVASAAGLLGSFANRKSRPTVLQGAFNTANMALSAGLAALVVFQLAGLPQSASIAASAAAYFVANTVIVSGILSLLQGKPLREVCREWYRGPFVFFLIGITAAGLWMNRANSTSPESWLLMLPLLYLVHFLQSLDRRREGEDVPSPLDGMPLRARFHLTGVICAGAALFGWGMTDWALDQPERFAAYMGAAVLFSGCRIRLPRMESVLSLGFVVTLVTISELSHPEILVIALASALVQSYWQAERRPMPLQVLFNACCLIISCTLAYGVTRIGMLPVVESSTAAFFAVACIALYVTNTFLVAAMIALVASRPLSSIWQRTYFWSLPYYLIGAGGAAVIATVARQAGWSAALVVLPILILLHITYRVNVSQRRAPAPTT